MQWNTFVVKAGRNSHYCIRQYRMHFWLYHMPSYSTHQNSFLHCSLQTDSLPSHPQHTSWLQEIILRNSISYYKYRECILKTSYSSVKSSLLTVPTVAINFNNWFIKLNSTVNLPSPGGSFLKGRQRPHFHGVTNCITIPQWGFFQPEIKKWRKNGVTRNNQSLDLHSENAAGLTGL